VQIESPLRSFVVDTAPPVTLLREASSPVDWQLHYPMSGRTHQWNALHSWYIATLKRTVDMVAASLLLIVLAPILFLVMVGIAVESPGPVLFRQVRCGRDGRRFTCLKFRTMVVKAEERLETDDALRLAFQQSRKLQDDPRVTCIGHWLRRLSIDETPQLVNVLRGEMSLVGPRPVPPDELRECYGEMAALVFAVKPGLTGLWQVSGRSNIDYPRRVQLDLEYARCCGFWFDLALLLRTIPALIGRRGAI